MFTKEKHVRRVVYIVRVSDTLVMMVIDVLLTGGRRLVIRFLVVRSRFAREVQIAVDNAEQEASRC